MSGEVQKVFCYLQWIVANLRTYNPLCRKKMAVVYFITSIPLTITQGSFSYQTQGLVLSGLPGLNESRCDVFLKKCNTAYRPFG